MVIVETETVKRLFRLLQGSTSVRANSHINDVVHEDGGRQSVSTSFNLSCSFAALGLNVSCI